MFGSVSYAQSAWCLYSRCQSRACVFVNVFCEVEIYVCPSCASCAYLVEDAYRNVPLATSSGGLLSNSHLVPKFIIRYLLLNGLAERLKC